MKRFMSSSIVRALFQRSGVARVIVAAAVAGLLIAGCDVHGISDPGTLTTLTIAPNPVILEVNGTQQFSVVGKDFSGANVTVSPTWSVEDGGGTFSNSGVFTAGTTPGTFTNTVRALTDGISNTATVIVIPGPLATIVVTPNPVVMGIGATQQFLAVGRDAAGNAVQFTPTWSVVADGGSVDATGFFTAGTVVGTYTNTIKASGRGISATATVTVTSGALATIVVTPNPLTIMVGGTQHFTAVGRDIGGNVVPFTPVWSIVSGGGTVGSAGLFTAGSTPGTFANTVVASSGGISGTATVMVTAGILATIEVTPSPATLDINTTQQFTAVGRDVGGNVVPINPTWSMVAGGGAIDLTTGLFTAGATVGTYTNSVRASVGGLAGFATVIVTGGPLAAITVTPNPVSLQTNDVQQFIAVGTDAGGNVFLMNPVWSVAAGGGTINSSGVFTAGTTPGTFVNTIRATVGAISGTATVTVIPGDLATITVTPNPTTMAILNTRQFIAVGRDGTGKVVAINPTWSVANGGGIINSGTGLFTAGAVEGVFDNTVIATSGAISGTATVTVTLIVPPPPLVDLGTAALDGIMAGQSVTCISGGIINADVAISPGNTVTGFGPGECVITGTQHLADGVAAQAQLDLTDAYNTLFGLPCPPANAIVDNLGGTTKPAGVYCTASGIGVTGTLTLDGGGDPNANFVFQAGTSLVTAGNIVLINDAQPQNVYWVVATSATLGTASQWQGNILALTSITLADNADLTGRALARNGSVTLGTNNVIILP